MKKIIGVLLFVLFILLLAAIGNAIKPKTPGASLKDEEFRASLLRASFVDVKDLNNKYRYFFSVTNEGDAVFTGNVKIALGRKLDNLPVTYDDFDVTIDPGVSKSVYLDALTGPVSVHGENGIAAYSYFIKVDGTRVGAGDGKISL